MESFESVKFENLFYGTRYTASVSINNNYGTRTTTLDVVTSSKYFFLILIIKLIYYYENIYV